MSKATNTSIVELDPFLMVDFRSGRIAKSALAPALVPKNSVANSINVDYSEIVGSGIVRKGKESIQQLAVVNLPGQGQTGVDDTTTNVAYGDNWFAQTFQVTSGQTPLTAVIVGLKRTGTPTSLSLSIYNTSAGKPSTLISVSNADIALISPGNTLNIKFLFSPFVTLVPGTTYALVLKVAGDVANNITWAINTAGGYASGEAQSSTDAGVSWTSITGEDFYFQIYYEDVSTPYNTFPRGLWAGIIGGSPKGVVVFQVILTPDSASVFYYFNGLVWTPSEFTPFTNTPIRFAVMNGSIFAASSGFAMRSSVDSGKTWIVTNCITTDSVVPTLLVVFKNRILAGGHASFPSRVYFSSIVDPNTSPFITWNTDPSTGDWIDINPDDGGVVTAFAITSNLVIVFKNNAMYRLNTVNKTVDTENIYNVGAVSQEAVINCLGLTYFYSGNGIYSTDGTFPQQISRLGVQDFIDAISDASKVFAGTDGFNVFFSIGDITLNYGPEDTRTYSNVVLKYSPRDQNWQVFTYQQHLAQYVQFGVAPTVKLINAQYNGYVSNTESPTPGDDGLAVPYQLETQELAFGNRSHTKVISDKIVVYTKTGGEGSFAIKSNDDNFRTIILNMNERVNVGKDVNFEGEFFSFLWKGEAIGSRPIIQGIHLPVVTDQGITK